MVLMAFHDAIDGYIHAQKETLWVRLRVRADQALRVMVRTEPDNEEVLTSMTPGQTEHGWQEWTAEIPTVGHHHQTRYLFKLITPDNSWWYGSAGLEAYMPTDTHMFRYAHDRQWPVWSASQVFYQIFPERFANGDSALSPVAGEYRYLDRVDIAVRDWDDAPVKATGGFEFFGGDLIGVKDRLSYLNDQLGITALYLNPVFTSQSSHKYDTVDYYNVDPHFGGNPALIELIEASHERGMKVVLDAVINHTSVMHPWFQAALHGDPDNRDRYVFDGQDYASWKGHKSLPTLDYANPQVVNDMITGDDSVIRHWMRPPYQIDGWRMDVIHMLGEGTGAQNNAAYLKLLRNVIKEENSQAMLLGEHFFEASSWLQGDQEDCAMNYFGFAHPVRAFLAGLDIAMDPIRISGEQFAAWLRAARARIPFTNQLLQFNQLDSHDTPRFYSMLQDDRDLMKVAIGFLMSYIGTPCLYYGTEIGMKGVDDPDCRRCFPWNRETWDESLLTHTQRWIALRKRLNSLSSGAIVDITSAADCLVFARVTETEQTLIALNRGTAISLDGTDCLPPTGKAWQCEEGNGTLDVAGDSWRFALPAKSITLWSR
ncbi:maltodextrin glucosidase [Reinekea blandensis]|uniref:Glycosidase n=1 Tax=Reinekea blandensis MED297 TaxID=314283 RepID=A4BC90_9GAMM|nr:maltodextrin glucosidase [Reinekea blandensis]EAR10156.1 Glycosidase [Reinekea sp. MED297] [Reinekea blandensis MED297]